jgi:hypothetical protein
MKEKIAHLWAQKIINGERKLSEVPKGLLTEVKKAIANLVNK